MTREDIYRLQDYLPGCTGDIKKSCLFLRPDSSMNGVCSRHRVVSSINDLFEAAQNTVDNGPCSDPDCCQTAVENAEAREALETALENDKSMWRVADDL